MKPIIILAFVLSLALCGCKKKAVSSPEIKSLTAEQIAKAMLLADSIRVIGEPQETITEVWNSSLKKTVIRHETVTPLELLIYVEEAGPG